MRSSLARKNAKVIDNAFARFLATQEQRFLNGMCRSMDYASEEALMLHDADHPNHVTTPELHGWILFHNGIEVAMEVMGNPDSQTDIRPLLRQVDRPANGWCGVVMAGMTSVDLTPTMTLNFNIEYEEDILIEVKNDLITRKSVEFRRKV